MPSKKRYSIYIHTSLLNINAKIHGIVLVRLIHLPQVFYHSSPVKVEMSSLCRIKPTLFWLTTENNNKQKSVTDTQHIM